MIEIVEDNKDGRGRFEEIVEKYKPIKKDLCEEFYKDLFEIRQPQFYKKFDRAKYYQFITGLKLKKEDEKFWIYYPWLNSIYLVPNENIYLEVITARNRPLVNWLDQQKFYNFNLGVVGLSVGQSAALTIVRSGGCKNIKIADFDIIGPSNLNRIHFGLPQVGQSKSKVLAQRLLEINPFANVSVFDKGLNQDNLQDFFQKDFKLDAVIDACDYFPTKIMIREFARKMKIPVLMATDVGDGSLLDIERYDLDDQIEVFGGRLKNIKPDDSFMQKALKIISPDQIPVSLIEVLSEVGKSTPTHPQLATSVYFSGVMMSYAVRRIATNQAISDKRHNIQLEEFLDPRHQDKKFISYKKAKVAELKALLGMEKE